MFTKQKIILQYSRDGKSQRKISKELGISRLTVKKYLDQITQEEQNNQSR